MAVPTMSGIYEIVNLANGKRYIGSAVSIDRRWREHLRHLRAGKHKNRYLQAAWLKYGEGAFAFRVLAERAVADLIVQEQAHIDAMAPEYNLSPTAGSTLGVKYSDEGRANLSAALQGKRRGKPRDPEAAAKTANAHRGMKRSAETCARISAALTGKKHPPRSAEWRQRLSDAQKGKSRSPEVMAALQKGRAAREFTDDQRAALAEATRRRYESGALSRERPPEYREKIAAALRGRELSPEHRAKISAAMKGRKRGPYKKKAATE